MTIDKTIFSLLFTVLIVCILSCKQQDGKTKVLSFAPKVVEARGYVVPKDSMAIPKVIPIGKLRTAAVGKPKIFIIPSNVHLVGNPKVVVAGIPKVCTPGQDSFALPKKVAAVAKPIIAGFPEVIIAKDASIKDQNPESFSSFGELQGLNKVVYCSLEDKNGNLWFGTKGGGVSKYDGKFFTHFTKKEGLSHNTVRTILEDKSGNLWFGTNLGGVTKYDGKSFTHFTEKEGFSSSSVVSILEDKSGNLWFGTRLDGVSLYDGKTFTHFTENEGLCNNWVWDILEDKSGNLWFGTEGGVCQYDGKSFFHFTKKEGLSDNTIRAIVEDKNGNLWFGTDEGVSQYDGKSFTHFTKKEGLCNNIVHCIIEDKNGNLWFGTQEGVSQYDGKSFTHFTEKEGLSNNDVRNIIEDKNGNFWFCTEGGGVSKYDGKYLSAKQVGFTHFTDKEGLRNNTVISILEDKSGSIWFGTLGGVSKYDGKSFTHFSLHEGYIVTSVLEDKSGNLWFGTDGDGVIKFDGKLFMYFTEKDGLLSNTIRFLLEDKKGNLWFGTDGGGVSKYSPNRNRTGGTFTHFTTKEELINNSIWAILEDKQGNLWFGSDGDGVSKYTPDTDGTNGTFTHFTQKQGLSHDDVWAIVEDKKGNLWFGTREGGVSKYTPDRDGTSGTFTHFTEREGLINNNVWSILEDKKGNLWFGTAGGISLLAKDYEQILAAEYKDADTYRDKDKAPILFKNFTYENGFLGIGCNRSSILEDKNGIIWIGANDRLTALHPANRNQDTTAPNIQLIGISLFNENIDWQRDTTLVLGNGVSVHDVHFDSVSKWYGLPQNLSLAYNNNYLTFNFVGITTESPKKVKYQYILDGIDKNWSTYTLKTEAHYGNLPYGTYTFKVKAMNDEGYWSKELTYTFTIRPPWWRTWLAYLLYTAMIGGSIYTFYRFQFKRQLEQAEAIRIKELDAVKTKLYTNITHEFRTPLTVILGMAQQSLDKPKEHFQEGLKMIVRNGQSLLNLVNQMLDLSKLESGKLTIHYQQGDVVNFLKYITESFHSYAENKGIQIHFLSDLEILTMDFDETRFQQIVSNLLSNAIKFTPTGGHIYVSVSVKLRKISNLPKIEHPTSSLILKIKDTGIGITEGSLPYIFDRFYQVDDTATRHGEGTGIGLALTQELVKLLEGTIVVKSLLNEGTEFEVTLPIRQVANMSEGMPMEKINNGKGRLSQTAINEISINENELLINYQSTSTEKPLVLIADDNADVRAYIASCLTTDYTLFIAKNGQECEDVAFDKTPDLIVSDVMMPLKDGFQVCKTLKNDERTSHIPIILLTAKADMDSKLQGLERGADAYLMKPFHKEELLLRIKKLLELRQQLQQHYRSTISDFGFRISDEPTTDIINPKYVIARDEATEGGYNPAEDIPTHKNNPVVSGLDNTFVLKVRATIETHLNDFDFDVEKLSRALAMSYSQVHRKLSALTGLSPNSFIRYVRLVKAKALLQNSGFSITAIAYDSGFNDAGYFSRVFKQEFGVTPQAWREQNLL